ncbi:MAG: DUF58 domain-containing protein [Candidatus Woesearchaeota archaeon]|nr:DUF58 domain-containing protein [Candidatus Woesearchaeota archaeon]
MITTDFLHQLDRFDLVVHKRVTSNYAGEKRSIAEGRGLVFKDHRIYAPGDDIREIDWKVYARTDDLYVKRYEEERNLTVHIIIDCSASMNFGKNVTKFEYAAMLGIGFAYLALKENEKFQVSTFSDDLVLIRPKRGLGQLASVVENLNNVKVQGFSKFAEAMFKYKKIINTRSLIVILSDFLVNLEDIKTALYLFGKHELKVIQILDPVEKEFILTGDLRLHDSETKEMLKTSISPRVRMLYQSKLAQHAAEIEKICKKLGVDFYSVTTDKPIFDAFYDILK